MGQYQAWWITYEEEKHDAVPQHEDRRFIAWSRLPDEEQSSVKREVWEYLKQHETGLAQMMASDPFLKEVREGFQADMLLDASSVDLDRMIHRLPWLTDFIEYR